MRDRFSTIGRRLAATFASFTPGQKAVTIVAVLGLVIGGIFFARWAAQPTYSPLFSNLSTSDASAIADKLDAAKTPYQLTDGGQTIMVPQDQVYRVRLQMSGQGLPSQGATGYALLDQQGVTQSDFQQQITYQRAMEGELAKTIESINGVNQAIVHLAIPKQDVFADSQQKPTASILVSTQPGTTLTSDQVQAVVNLVSSSIEGLTPQNVTLADSTGQVLWSGGENGMLSAGGDARAQQTDEYEQELSDAVQQMLDQVAGQGHAVVKVTADLDYDQTHTRSQRYIYDKNVPPIADSKTTETYTGAGAAVGGVLGPDNNGVPIGTTGGNNGAQSGYKKVSDTRNNAVGQVVEDRQSAPGEVKKLNVAVLLDSRTTRNLSTSAVNNMVMAAAGLNTKRGDTINVTKMPFDLSAAKQAQAELNAAQKATQRSSFMSMLKVGVLVLAVLILVALGLLSGRRKQRRQQLTPGELERLDQLKRELESADARAVTAAESRPELEPPTSTDPEIAVRASRQDEIAALVERQPDEVAQLLRGWLADRRS